MAAILSEKKCVGLDGLIHQFFVWKPNDVVECHGAIFVRMSPSSYSLREILLEKNVLAPEPVPKRWSLSCSVGMNKLMELRNEQQAASLRGESNTSCNLFDDSPPSDCLRRACRVPRPEIQKKRQEHDVLTVELELDGESKSVRLLRPMHPRDNLFIEYEAHTLGLVLRYFRALGFSDVKEPRPDLPKGILNRKGMYLVRHVKDNGEMGLKKFDELDAAIAFLSESDHHNSVDIGEADSAVGSDGPSIQTSDVDADASDSISSHESLGALSLDPLPIVLKRERPSDIRDFFRATSSKMPRVE